jgi:ankyrin repeat protein
MHCGAVIAKAKWPWVLLLLAMLVAGCDRGVTIRHGNLIYSAREVFGNGTPEMALAVAAARGDVKEINRLVAAGAIVNFIGQHNITPLWWAAWAENHNGFYELLEKGANPNAQREEGYPIMYLVAEIKDSRFLEAALKHGGDPNLRDKRSDETPLFRAVLNDFSTNVELLLVARADTNAQLPVSGETIPMVAIGANNDYKIVYELFQHGANPALKDRWGNTLAVTIENCSKSSTNNDDPWRKKVIDYMRNKGVNVKDSVAQK